MKRSRRSVFDAVELLDDQDDRAAKIGFTERDRQQSRAAQSQTKIYGSLVEARILLQRSLQAAAQQNQQQQQASDVDNSSHTAAVELCNSLLAKLLQARQTLFPIPKNDTPDYEELVRQQDEDVLSATLQSEFSHHQEEWKEVLDRRNRDVRLHSGALTNKTKFRVMDASFWQQVEATVQHEELRQKQQQQQQQQHQQQQPESGSLVLFDDSKVYHHLLKDFVSNNVQGDAQAAARQRLVARQNKAAGSGSSGKSRAQVDRRASKGRKIRYTEIPKLTNFTFPLSRAPNSSGSGGGGNDLDEDAWFRSLFGGAARSKK